MKEEDKSLLIKTINKKGFILEDRTWKTLNDNFPLNSGIARGSVTRKNSQERIEIDVVLVIESRHFIIECKHTDYSWIFPKPLNRSNDINLIHNYTNSGALNINSRSTSDFQVVYNDLCILLNKDGSVKKESKSDYAQSSYRDVHDAVRQVLKNLKVYLIDYIGNPKGYFFIPTIVTNADLYFMDYSEKDINEKGDFTNFKRLEKIPYLIYNFSEILGEPFSNNEAPMKSIFIININHLKEAINIIKDQSLAGKH